MSRSFKYLVGMAASAITVIGVGAAQVASSSQAWADDDDGDKLPLYLTRTLDPTAQDSSTPGFIWQGAGNPAANFLVKINPDDGIELAIKAIMRQGPDIRPTYVDNHGRVHVEVPTGPQIGNPSRAAWSFTFSFNASLPGASPSLDDYDASLWIDLDPSNKTKYLKLKLARLGTPPCAGPEPDCNGWGWKSGNTVVINDDDGTQRVTQNSQQIWFYRNLIDIDPNTPGIQPYNMGPGEFDVVLKMKKKGGNHNHNNNNHNNNDHDDDDNDDATTIHVVFNVVAAPTP